MASETDIANLALSRIGQTLITSMSEGTSNADLCNLHYPIARDALLRAHPWNFAIKRATLASDTTTPEFEFSYRFPLPSDCLKVIRTSLESTGFTGSAIYGFPGIFGYASELFPYRVEGRAILSNESSFSIEYIAQITDTTQYDSLFVDILAQRLAAEIAPRITDTATTAKAMWDIYNAKLVEARLMDAQEGTPREVVDTSPWLTARV